MASAPTWFCCAAGGTGSLAELADLVKSKSWPWGVGAREGSWRLVGVSDDCGCREVDRVPSFLSRDVAPTNQHWPKEKEHDSPVLMPPLLALSPPVPTSGAGLPTVDSIGFSFLPCAWNLAMISALFLRLSSNRISGSFSSTSISGSSWFGSAGRVCGTLDFGPVGIWTAWNPLGGGPGVVVVVEPFCWPAGSCVVAVGSGTSTLTGEGSILEEKKLYQP